MNPTRFCHTMPHLCLPRWIIVQQVQTQLHTLKHQSNQGSLSLLDLLC